ncbi:MAG: hypothetical protein KME49_21365 [Brasilonema octagenarum HA4186-MV1]|jgi:hypothetical protein|uniref:DUF4234 domain-containing protein n=2 Tax=Brasilonema TaxID=383614 RepID=A0A856MC65_9CYAN|nr:MULTISPECIES: hypothetical protein [Brasilonema]MBW4627987.1 hypothetical protein [Brasilonema octagenarum HA4186-MV1]NMF62160.1 hypothetical protein [Brasilonema octagenarum UFV-OR1]QDL08773.1 hypothetical protein DP114_13510 [Brasilonema sennae CENA114]QDL15131.1 hypothetical protein DP113_13455 [Brasilonema octagenarum UFV-E1]
MNQYNHRINNGELSNIMPLWKFCTLYIFTLGIYQLPWAHKQWKFLKERNNPKISAWFRSWFLPFYLYSLSQKLFALAEEQGYREKPSPFRVTFFYWIFYVLDFHNSLQLVWLLSFIPLLTVLKAVNYYWQQQQPNIRVNESFTGREIVWMVFGVILWISNIYVYLNRNKT